MGMDTTPATHKSELATLKLVETLDRGRQLVFETAHASSLPRNTFVMTIEPNEPGDDVGPHACANCGQVLISGPIQGRLDGSVVLQCPVCRAYNKAAD